MHHPGHRFLHTTDSSARRAVLMAACLILLPLGAQAAPVFGSITYNPSDASSSSFASSLVSVDFDHDTTNGLAGGGTREAIVNGVIFDQVRESGSGQVTTFSFAQLVDSFSGLWDLSYSSSSGLFTTGGTDGLTLQAFRGATQVFSGCINGNTPTTGCASIDGQERVSYGISGVQFDRVQISLLAPGTTEAYSLSNLTVTVVPEPETFGLMLAGLGAIGLMARRRRNA